MHSYDVHEQRPRTKHISMARVIEKFKSEKVDKSFREALHMKFKIYHIFADRQHELLERTSKKMSLNLAVELLGCAHAAHSALEDISKLIERVLGDGGRLLPFLAWPEELYQLKRLSNDSLDTSNKLVWALTRKKFKTPDIEVTDIHWEEPYVEPACEPAVPDTRPQT